METGSQNWVASPSQGVWRKPLEREAKESGHVTSVVKYEAGSRFSPHLHPYGEEIFVLSGEFRDELGIYPTHTWLRSPHMSEHFPFVEEETVIWVKTGHLPLGS
ncbi:hypothetical protein CGI34_07840 [Vibrio parahaemolyticus]|nr:hypothetical protein CGI34_07840 [Vibrio parahaemolyticus]